MIINEVSYRFLRGYTPTIKPAIKWNKKSNGKWAGNDYGQSNDIHESSITLFESYEKMESLITFLRSDDGTGYFFLIVDKGEFPFGPHIHDNSIITVIVTKYGKLKKVNTKDIYELNLTLRLIDHTAEYISDDVTATDFTSDLLYSIKHVDENIEMDRSWQFDKYDTYVNTFTVIDSGYTEGTVNFTIRIFENGGSNLAGQLIKGLLTRVRNNDFHFPSNSFFGQVWSVNNPFGPDSVGPWITKIVEFKLGNKENANYWDVAFRMVEV